MKILRLYFETTIFGFYYDTLPQNATKQESTIKLFEQLNKGKLVGLVSGLVINELEKAPEPYRKQLLTLFKKYPLARLQYEEEEAQRLAKTYLKEGAIPRNYPNDAVHVAIATVSEVDILVTWNCKHIANEFRIRQIRSINMKEGYSKELSIRIPEEVIIYAD